MVYIYRDGMYIYILYIYAHAHKNIHKSDELTQLPTDGGRSYIAWTSSESKMQIWKHSGGLWMSWLRMGRMGPWSTHAMDIRPMAGPQMGWPRGLLGFGGADSMIQHHVVNSISMFDVWWCLMMFHRWRGPQQNPLQPGFEPQDGPGLRHRSLAECQWRPRGPWNAGILPWFVWILTNRYGEFWRYEWSMISWWLVRGFSTSGNVTIQKNKGIPFNQFLKGWHRVLTLLKCKCKWHVMRCECIMWMWMWM